MNKMAQRVSSLGAAKALYLSVLLLLVIAAPALAKKDAKKVEIDLNTGETAAKNDSSSPPNPSPPSKFLSVNPSYSYHSAAAGYPTSSSFPYTLPGHTRSKITQTYALISPESRVYAPNILPGFLNITSATVISPSMPGSQAHFTMYLARTNPSDASALGTGSSIDSNMHIERLIYILEGSVKVDFPTTMKKSTCDLKTKVIIRSVKEHFTLIPGGYVYLPPRCEAQIVVSANTSFIVIDRVYRFSGSGSGLGTSGSTTKTSGHGRTDSELPKAVIGDERDIKVEQFAGEMFELRRLLPITPDYDFNIHIMDFQPGDFLNVKEVHYNQHGLLMLQGQGVYRLGEEWYAVTTGDVIYMAPFVVQWYGALGRESTRYFLYKDTARDPLVVQ